MPKVTDKVLDVRFGAIYRFAAKTGMSQLAVEALLAQRAAMSTKDAIQLADHWFTTEPLRNHIGD
ncbi:hypothetical protein [Mesorhizobium sp. URHB0026]